MSSGPAFQPSPEDLEHSEQLYDLLIGSSNLQSDMQQALELILSWQGQSRGGLYVSNRTGKATGFWLQSNLPYHWQNQLEDEFSEVHDLVHQVIESGQPVEDHALVDLAGAFPIQAGQQTVGVLLILGSPIETADYPRWEFLLKPIGRAVSLHRRGRIRSGLQSEISALQGIASILSGDNEINALQRRILQGMRDIFDAEDVMLVLVDDDNPRMAIKKQLGMGEDWVERTSLELDDSPVNRSIREGRCLQEDLCSTDNFSVWLNSSVNMSVRKVICSPLVANHCATGAVVLLNPELDVTDFYRKSLLHQLTAILANALYSSRQVLNLKISIADLEASRWEIVNSRNTLRTLFDSIPSSVYIIDRTYTLISINMRRSNRAGRRPSMLVGKKCYEQLYARTDPCPACRIMDTFSNGSITTRFSREWLDQEKFIEWEITTFPIQEKNNMPHQVIIFEEDVTEKRNLEANLIQSEKLAAVGQLAAGVAHEINNPLAAIIANAQILKRELRNSDPDTLDAIKLIETAGVRASQVVSNLLGIARKEKRYEFEMLSLNDTILSAISLVHHEVVNHGIEMKLDLQDDMPDIVASKNQIQGVWINMIVNSMDAIDRPDGQISISTRFIDHEFRIILSDNGKGIPEDQLTRIFEPFFTTKVAGKGTGLGLSVCLRVIKEHQGSVNVESFPDKGTKFTIVLPDLSRPT